MGEDTSRLVLESECPQLLFLLVLRIHDIDGLCPGSRTGYGVLETSNATINQNRPVCHDEHNNVVCGSYRRQRHLPALVHGYDRSTLVPLQSRKAKDAYTAQCITQYH